MSTEPTPSGNAYREPAVTEPTPNDSASDSPSETAVTLALTPMQRHRKRAPMYLLAAAAVGTLAVVGLRGRHDTPRFAAPTLPEPNAMFPVGVVELPVAAPLAPLLARTEPEQLGLVSPSGSVQVSRGTSLEVRFNRAMVASTELNRPLAHSPLVFNPPVEGVARWLSRSLLVFEPTQSAFDRGVETQMTVEPTLTAHNGERFVDTIEPRTVVFAGGATARLQDIPRSAMPGDALRLVFSGRPDLATVATQLVAYESSGAMRPLRFSLQPRGTNPQGMSLVDLRLNRVLEAGARVAMLFAPTLLGSSSAESEDESGSGGSVGTVFVQLQARPHIAGVACTPDAESVENCAPVGEHDPILDVTDTLRLLANVALDTTRAPTVTVTPPVSAMVARFASKPGLFEITAEWEPDQVYEVRVDGLLAQVGGALQRVAPLAVRSGGRAPNVAMREGLQAYELDAPAVFPFQAVHIDRGTLTYTGLSTDAALEAVISRSLALRGTPEGAPIRLAQLAPQARANHVAPGQFRFIDPAQGRTQGIARLSFRANNTDTQQGEQQAIVQRTDLGLAARAFPQGVQVWLTSIATGQPVANAQVQTAWIGANGLAKSASVRTDANGLAWIAATGDLALIDRVFAVSAEHREDRAVIAVDPRRSLTPENMGISSAGRAAGSDAPVAAIFADRGAYRPGDTVHVKVIARTPTVCGPRSATSCSPENLQPLRRTMLRVELVSPFDNDAVERHDVRSNGWGTVDTALALPARAGAGDWRVRVSTMLNGRVQRQLSEHTVRVAEFRPPTMRVDLSDVPENAVNQDAIAARISARYLFGAPANAARARWTLTRSHASEAPLPWANTYTFEPIDADHRSASMERGEITLDAQGQGVIEAHLRTTSHAREWVELETEVQDASGQSTAARRRILVHPAAQQVAVLRTAPWLGAGATLDVQSVVLDPSGAVHEGASVQARIVREGWGSYYEWAHAGDEAGGAYRARRTRDEREVARCTLRSTQDPMHCRWTPDRPGTYRLEATLTDQAGNVSIASHRVYVAAPGEHADRDAPGAPITVSPSQRSYGVGERARVAFESPWADAQALVTVAREGVVHTEIRRVNAGGNIFEFEVSPAMVPNAFVHVSLVRPRTGPPGQGVDLNAPDLRLGVAEIGVRPRVSSLGVSVTVDAVSRPGEEIPVAVQVRDAEGRPVRAEVALYVVDEGTLRLSSYETPRPGEQFFPRRAPRFVIEDLRRALVSRLDLVELTGASGDGTEDNNGLRAMRDERERFEPTALWLPHLNTGADGVARARLRLPQRPTQYRVIAVANDATTRTGGTSTQLTATRPAVLRPLVPTAVVEGDRFEASTFVNNPTEQPVDAVVTLAMGTREVHRETVHLAAGAEARVAVSVEVPVGAERMDLVFEARAGDSTDRREVTVAVLQKAVSFSAFTAGSIATDRVLTVQLPPGAVSRGSHIELTVAAHPFVGLEPARDALLNTEQESLALLATRVRGLLAYAALSTQPERSAEARQLAQRGLDRLASLQTPEGGFLLNDGSGDTARLELVDVLDAVERARAAGLRMPPSMRDGSMNSVRTLLRADSLTDYRPEQSGWGRNDYSAMAAGLLITGGHNQTARLAMLIEQKETLSPAGIAALALAMPASDRRRETLLLEAARRVLVRLEPPTPLAHRGQDAGTRAHAPLVSPPRWDVTEHLNRTPVRSLAALIDAMIALSVGPDEVRKLCTFLLQKRLDGSWLTPEDNAAALVALARYAAELTRVTTPNATVSLDGAAIQGRTLGRTQVFSLPAESLTSRAHQLRMHSDSPAFFALDARWLRPLNDGDLVARGRVAALHRVFERENGQRLESGAHVRTGDLVRVRLIYFTEQFTTRLLSLRDPIVGGFDSVDRGLDTTPSAGLDAMLGTAPGDDFIDPRGHLARASLSYITRRTFAPTAALFSIQSMPRTVQEFTYAIRAATPGTYTMLPAVITSPIDRSFVARSAASTLVIDR
ncbi:MAG: MG2 domain-containing protein [Deltaproteobacteria bacterium]|nr:MG2 domain-containing protein [Deltaproteobacteria bacterium]